MPQASASLSELRHPRTQLWVLRALLLLNAHTRLIGRDGFEYESVADCLGLKEEGDASPESFDRGLLMSRLRRMRTRLERLASSRTWPEPLGANLRRLGTLLGLKPLEQELLGFSCLVQAVPALDEVADHLQLRSGRGPKLQRIARLLQADPLELDAALSRRGKLAQSGLGDITLSRSSFGLANEEVARLLVRQDVGLQDLMRHAMATCPPPSLSLADYPHVRASVDILLARLRDALERRLPGVNFLIHGAPGTGKTQLARVLAAQLRAPLHEVSREDEDGDAATSRARLQALRLAHQLLKVGEGLLVVDEAEDLFEPPLLIHTERRPRSQLHKSWLTRTLELNPVPTLWLANDIRSVDPALLRRFDHVFEMPLPPQAQRLKMLRQHGGELLGEALCQRLARLEGLSPATLARAVEVTQSVQRMQPETPTEPVVSHLIDCSLKALGHPQRCPALEALGGSFDPGLLRTDLNLDELVRNLATQPARLCLHGLPGTGKTAMARWLADRLGRPLLERLPSDLLGSYVGESERQVAQAFREAEQQGAILLVDEVDSLLRVRGAGDRSWETSLVNEMLVQMERFQGVFVATTNRLESLDPACLRRFDLKLGFEPLAPVQAQALLQRTCASLGLDAPDAADLARLGRLAPLTAGDFASAARGHRLQPLRRAEDLIDRLQQACRLKPAQAGVLGFL